MTKADLCDWVIAHGCTTELLPEFKARVIYLVNPKNDCEVWLDLPIDNKPMRANTVCKICSDLQIPIPTFAKYMKPIDDEIRNDDKEVD